ncbi:Nit-4-like protein [Apiospora arundinis]|uniref:ubiquitinyl hydrolase 1 n=1 Tax=Apiospora arundinis TaxID=335852 RepID=A0ABR2J4Q3_9PEZI
MYVETRLAVPFRVKDDPAPRAEFSHPDVAIFLTCLRKQDDQSQPEYHIWTLSAPKLPVAFHELAGVNLRDKIQFATEVFPHLRYSKGTIDYFLSKTVFAREMKEFPRKLSTSGWDLGKVKKHPTTGFSGTNDSRYILLLTVTQLDQAEQRHTNALVPRSKHQTTSKDEYISDSKPFLESVSSFEPEARVILDVGAQMVDLSNRQVAETWLEVTRDCPKDREAAQAVISFDDEDVLSVLDRPGRSEPFQTSHFAQ